MSGFGDGLTVPGPGASFERPPASAEAMSIMHPQRPGKAARGLLAVILLLAGCASVPYQEMSDARQAIDAARHVVADAPQSRTLVQEAERELGRAEAHLRAGEYDAARVTAEKAKTLAIEARERAEDGD